MAFKDDLLKITEDFEKEYVVVFNNGKSQNENQREITRCKEAGLIDTYYGILYEIKEGYNRISLKDGVPQQFNLGLSIGVIYNKKDVNDDNSIVEGAVPATDEIHFYTEDLDIFCANGLAEYNDVYNECRVRHHGYMKFNDFISRSKNEGFDIVCPETFEEYVAAIKTGEPFEVSLNMKLGNQIEVSPEEVEQDKPKKRIKFFRK